MKTVELSVTGMSCGHCVQSVRSALGGVRGVAQVDVSLKGKNATVRADDAVADGALLEAVRRAGYQASVRRAG
jgi:copper ion binding protein